MATQTYTLPRFKAGAPLLEQVTAERLNAILDAVEAGRIVFGKNITGTRTTSGVILRGNAGGAGGGAAAGHPFRVYQSVDNQDPPYPILKVFPGKVGTVVPTMNSGGTNAAGARLDVSDDAAGSHPWLYTPSHPFSLYLRCQIDLTDPTLKYRSYITTVRVVTSDDADAIEDRDNNTQELQIVWEGVNYAEKAAKTKGHFYLNVADVAGGEDDGGNITIGQITQWLFTSYRTFGVIADTAVVLA